MALDKTFNAGEILSASNVNGHLLSMWIPIDKRVISSGSPATTVTFSSLDSNFRLFRLTYYLSLNGGLWLRLNNDSGTNYAQQDLVGTGNTAGGGQVTNGIAIDLSHFQVSDPALGQWVIGKLDSSTQARIDGGTTVGPHANLLTYHSSCSWNNTSSLLNRIDLLEPNGTGDFYGVVALEGMRGV